MSESQRIHALEALLARTEEAHGAYETSELNGVYDQDWPSWYAQYAVDHGIGELLARAVTADELRRFLETGWREMQTNPKLSEPWPSYTARRIAEELAPEKTTDG